MDVRLQVLVATSLHLVSQGPGPESPDEGNFFRWVFWVRNAMINQFGNKETRDSITFFLGK